MEATCLLVQACACSGMHGRMRVFDEVRYQSEKEKQQCQEFQISTQSTKWQNLPLTVSITTTAHALQAAISRQPNGVLVPVAIGSAKTATSATIRESSPLSLGCIPGSCIALAPLGRIPWWDKGHLPPRGHESS